MNEFGPAEVMVDTGGDLPVLRPVDDLPPLTVAEVRDALDASRPSATTCDTSVLVLSGSLQRTTA